MPLNRIEEIGASARIPGPSRPWLVVIVAALGIAGGAAFAGPRLPSGADADGLTGGLDRSPVVASPLPSPSAETPVVAPTGPQSSPDGPTGSPLVGISQPTPGAQVTGNLVVVRGQAAVGLGAVTAAVVVAGRPIGTVEVRIDEPGPFAVAVPVVAAAVPRQGRAGSRSRRIAARRAAAPGRPGPVGLGARDPSRPARSGRHRHRRRRRPAGRRDRRPRGPRGRNRSRLGRRADRPDRRLGLCVPRRRASTPRSTSLPRRPARS